MSECLIVRKGASFDADYHFMVGYENAQIILTGGTEPTDQEYTDSLTRIYTEIEKLVGVI